MDQNFQKKYDKREEHYYLKYIRIKLWSENPYCVYCGIETILPDDHRQRRGVPVPKNVATIDHKYSRYNPMRNVEKQELLLSCNLCNNYRAQLEEDKIPIEELRTRSQRAIRYRKSPTTENSTTITE